MPTWRESVSFDANVEALSALEGPGLQLTRILEDDVPALLKASVDESSIVREHAHWALEQLASRGIAA